MFSFINEQRKHENLRPVIITLGITPYPELWFVRLKTLNTLAQGIIKIKIDR